MRFPAGCLLLCGLLSACGHPAPSAVVRPVQTMVIHYGTGAKPLSLTGRIQAQNETNLAFRIGGRLIERSVSIGESVVPGRLVARIESQDAKNALISAQADLAAAQAALVAARNSEQRYRTLVASGVVSRAQYDDAQQQLAAAQSRDASAAAAVQTARNNVGYTELHSNVAGVVTATGAEPGEVVQAGQMIVQVAGKGGKDAVFNVPAALMRESPKNPTVTVALVDDPSITAAGHVREVSPQADPATGTYTVKVGLDTPPDTMRLGATVTGSVTLSTGHVVTVPCAALIQLDGKPGVWVVDPVSKKVDVRLISLERCDGSTAVISGGLTDGDLVVTAGVHALRPGQQVRLLQTLPG